MKLLLTKKFEHWIDEIEENNYLYRVLSETGDLVIAGAVSGDPEKFLKQFTGHISKTKVDDIKTILLQNYSSSERIESQITVIQNYRKFAMEKINPGHDTLEYLLNKLSDKNDFLVLLYDTGWFTLSTALKDVRKKTANYILDNIPHSTGYLIEDVLRGIINPGIIHDEMQINMAKRKCIRSIFELYSEGYINFP